RPPSPSGTWRSSTTASRSSSQKTAARLAPARRAANRTFLTWSSGPTPTSFPTFRVSGTTLGRTEPRTCRTSRRSSLPTARPLCRSRAKGRRCTIGCRRISEATIVTICIESGLAKERSRRTRGRSFVDRSASPRLRRAGYFTDPRETRRLRALSCGPSIIVMDAAEHWEGDDVSLGRALCMDRRSLPEPLVRPSVVVVADVLGNDAVEVPVVEHEDGGGGEHPGAMSSTARPDSRSAVGPSPMPVGRTHLDDLGASATFQCTAPAFQRVPLLRRLPPPAEPGRNENMSTEPTASADLHPVIPTPDEVGDEEFDELKKIVKLEAAIDFSIENKTVTTYKPVAIASGWYWRDPKFHAALGRISEKSIAAGGGAKTAVVC